jgi:hypothetical protein
LVAVEKMFELVASVLRENGIFCLYGPFRQDGRFSSESNSNFHRSLRAKDKEMGIRHLEELDIFSVTGGLCRKGLYAMPANNLMLVWRRIEGESDGDS